MHEDGLYSMPIKEQTLSTKISAGDIKLDYHCIDDSQIQFYQRLEALKQAKPTPIKDERILPRIITRLYKEFPGKIEKMLFFRRYSAAQFRKVAFFYKILLVLYLGVYLTPFLLQISFLEGDSAKRCLHSCLAGQIFFLILELIQISAENLKEYFKQGYNWNDLLSFTAFVAYYVIRMGDSADTTPQMATEGEEQRKVEEQFVLTVLNMIMLVQSIVKIFFLTRVFENIGQLVQLVIQVLSDVVEFSLFYVMFLFYFYLMFLVSGFGVDAEDYGSLKPLTYTWI